MKPESNCSPKSPEPLKTYPTPKKGSTPTTCYQAYIWTQALIQAPDMPKPSGWGWTKDMGEWQPVWTTLPKAATSCAELIRCSCKKGYTGRCKCSKAALKCTALCFCAGDC